MVNRVWQHYFGYGIVRTPNNFGYKGDLPTHPQLLDWLASELIEHDWNLKTIHRLILTSRTYRQQSGRAGHGAGHFKSSHSKISASNTDSNTSNSKTIEEAKDPLNLYLSRMNRKRLSAESIRDTFLSHSRQLNLQMGGRGFTPDVSAEALEGLSKRSNAWQPSSRSQQSRRGCLFVRQTVFNTAVVSQL